MRRRHTGIIVSLAIVTSLVMLGSGLAIGQALETADRQALLQPFYTPPDVIPAEPGTVIRTEPLDVAVPHGTAQRILYASRRSDGTPVASSGLLFLPDSPAPVGGRPILAWAHGTVGMADRCAPSRSTNPLQDTFNWLPQLLEAGIAVVATDYAGLGTPGVNEYLVARAEANDVVYSVLAARQISSDIGTRWVVAGHSQGGHSAIWTGHLARDLAPGLTLLGVAAAAPAAELQQITGAQWPTGIGWVIGPEVSTSWPSAYPGTPLAGVLTRPGRDNYQRMADTCILDAAAEGFVRSRFGQTFFTADPSADPKWDAILTEQTPAPLPPDMPFLLEQGTADEVVLPQPNARLQVEWCRAGSTLAAVWLGGVGHMKIAVTAGPVMAGWVMDRFEGRPAPSTCNIPPPVATTVPAPAATPS